FIVAPPGLSDMVIGQQAAVLANEKAGAKNVELKMRPSTFEIQLHISFVVEYRFAELIDGDEQRFAGGAVEEFDNDMEQAYARTVRSHDSFGDFAVVLDAVEPVLRLGKLTTQVAVTATACGHFLFQLVRLGLQGCASGRLRGGV